LLLAVLIEIEMMGVMTEGTMAWETSLNHMIVVWEQHASKESMMMTVTLMMMVEDHKKDQH